MIAAWKPAADRRGQQLATDAITSDDGNNFIIDDEVAAEAGSDVRYGASAFEIGEYLVVRRVPGSIYGKRQVVRLSVECGRAGQVGQAGTEDRRRAQCRDGQDCPKHCRADRNRIATATPFEGMANTDQRAGRGTATGEKRHNAGRPHHPRGFAGIVHASGSDGRPQTQGEDDDDRHQCAE